MRKKIYVTASDMMQLREQGLSNHDIAKSLDVSEQTVRRYIGKQPGRMERLEAFRDVPRMKTEEKDEAQKSVMPKYCPKPVIEKYRIGDCFIELDNKDRVIAIDTDGACVLIQYEAMPELVQFFAWAMRERMEADADVRAE